jgi:hypothetical protein
MLEQQLAIDSQLTRAGVICEPFEFEQQVLDSLVIGVRRLALPADHFVLQFQQAPHVGRRSQLGCALKRRTAEGLEQLIAIEALGACDRCRLDLLGFERVA